MLTYVYVFSSLLLIENSLLTWRWPSTAETCRHRRTNKLRSLDSCVLTDLPTLICIKHNGDDKPEDYFVKCVVLIVVTEDWALSGETQCNLVDRYQPFGLMYCVCVQDSGDSILKM